jgi:hypothetical protein
VQKAILKPLEEAIDLTKGSSLVGPSRTKISRRPRSIKKPQARSAIDLLYIANARVRLKDRIFNIDVAASAMSIRPLVGPMSLSYKVNITLLHEVYHYKSRMAKDLVLRTSQGEEVLYKFLKYISCIILISCF